MNITYIHHSCFSVELDNVILLFDYYKGNIPSYDANKHIFVFSSHSHHDHFNPSIFELSKDYPNITYILSHDIKLDETNISNWLSIKNNIHFMDKHEKVQYNVLSQVKSIVSNTTNDVNENSIQVETYLSTDEGVAFIVTYHDKVIYHAGDLHWWSWEGETQEEYIDMTSRFKKEIKLIQGRDFDVAFLPLDPRQEGRFWWGFDHFMRETHTKVAIPMHFWGDYSIIDKLKTVERAKEYESRVIKLTKEDQVIQI